MLAGYGLGTDQHLFVSKGTVALSKDFNFLSLFTEFQLKLLPQLLFLIPAVSET